MAEFVYVLQIEMKSYISIKLFRELDDAKKEAQEAWDDFMGEDLSVLEWEPDNTSPVNPDYAEQCGTALINIFHTEIE